MKYFSTRSQPDSGVSFDDALLSGLAPDGGLFLPKEWPQFSDTELRRMSGMTYAELATEIIFPFVEGSIDRSVLDQLLQEAYANFSHVDVAPVVRLTDRLYVTELFHGPTFAFKDYALQVVGKLFDHILRERDERLVIVGATSGDTGSAAIHGCRGQERLDIFIMHPNNKISAFQRKQMTTVHDANVHNIALEGSFDDCQAIVKQILLNGSQITQHRVGAINSINWARIMCQIVYYFWSAMHAKGITERHSFAVPTGNFGNIFAGYAARQMGLKVDQLIAVSNSNNALHRFLETGKLTPQSVLQTLTPSMDIQSPSNLERLLFEAAGRQPDRIAALMKNLAKFKQMELSDKELAYISRLCSGQTWTDSDTLSAIRENYENFDIIFDPHSAIGVSACQREGTEQTAIALATAHPCKFAPTIADAVRQQIDIPSLEEVIEDYIVLPNNYGRVATYVSDIIQAGLLNSDENGVEAG